MSIAIALSRASRVAAARGCPGSSSRHRSSRRRAWCSSLGAYLRHRATARSAYGTRDPPYGTAEEAQAAAQARLSSVANSIRLTQFVLRAKRTSSASPRSPPGCGLAKSTVHRLAATLIECGILEQNRENGKYRLGMALFELGALVRRRMDVANEGAAQAARAAGEDRRDGAARRRRPSQRALRLRDGEPPRHPHGGRGRRARAAALHRGGQGAARVSSRADFVEQVLRRG